MEILSNYQEVSKSVWMKTSNYFFWINEICDLFAKFSFLFSIEDIYLFYPQKEDTSVSSDDKFFTPILESSILDSLVNF